MIRNVQVENFRSLENVQLELAPITVLYGPTAAGKSSLLYAMCLLRNFIYNPAQALDALFNFPFQNLGGFDACVFNHDAKRGIEVSASTSTLTGELKYSISFSKSNSVNIELEAKPTSGKGIPAIRMKMQAPIPYQANQGSASEIEFEGAKYTVNWNGILSSVVPAEQNPSNQEKAKTLTELLNTAVEVIRGIDMIPQRRGFFKPVYSPVQVNPMTATGEDEVATLLISDQNLAAKVSIDTDDIFHRDFRVVMQAGTAIGQLQITDKTSRIPVALVNDGFGVNQVVYILSKIYTSNSTTVLIEEPEIHLHPSIIRKFVGSLCRIAKEEGKQLVVTTHSEQFLVSMLTNVAEGHLDSRELKCYHVKRDKKVTDFEEQKVGDNGQIEGGLVPFLESELEDVRTFLKVKKQ